MDDVTWERLTVESAGDTRLWDSLPTVSAHFSLNCRSPYDTLAQRDFATLPGSPGGLPVAWRPAGWGRKMPRLSSRSPAYLISTWAQVFSPASYQKPRGSCGGMSHATSDDKSFVETSPFPPAHTSALRDGLQGIPGPALSRVWSWKIRGSQTCPPACPAAACRVPRCHATTSSGVGRGGCSHAVCTLCEKTEGLATTAPRAGGVPAEPNKRTSGGFCFVCQY